MIIVIVQTDLSHREDLGRSPKSLPTGPLLLLKAASFMGMDSCCGGDLRVSLGQLQGLLRGGKIDPNADDMLYSSGLRPLQNLGQIFSKAIKI